MAVGWILLALFLLWATVQYVTGIYSCPACGTRTDEHDRDCPWRPLS